MKVKYLSRTHQLTFELAGNTASEIWEELSEIQEVFDSDVACGICGATPVRFRARENSGNTYHELVCTNKDCRARLSFGQHRTGGGLFPKRKDKEGNWLPSNGWERFSGKV